jgi:hypothetical protein
MLAEIDCCIGFWLVDGPDDILNVLFCVFRRRSAVGGNLVSFICSLVDCAPPDTFLVLDTLDGWMALRDVAVSLRLGSRSLLGRRV